MRFQKAEVSSPATIANFGPGFDSFGLCLASPVDRISISRREGEDFTVEIEGDHGLPVDPEKNTASFAALKLAEKCECDGKGFSMSIQKGMKPGSGIGSSAASSVGGAVAMAALLGVRDKRIILEAAAMGEELISGSRHFDNVAAALYGGFTFVSDHSSKRIIRIEPPTFNIVVLLPEIEIRTGYAREMIPESVPMADAVANLSWAAGMVHSMMSKDIEAVAHHLNDKLVIPYRQGLIPGYAAVRESALNAGALAVSIGGSGPAIFAIAREGTDRILEAMAEALRSSAGLEAESFVTEPGTGAKVLSVV
ncbi:MAG: homoserine kinase [Methanobacteriota archaeon]|nr:MAG: homoserine kinase [Euryarchaeota archaeon]